MNKVICKVTYNTEVDTLVKKVTVGYYGDPAGYEESLYQTPAGLYFLYVCGGEDSIYPAEDIIRMALVLLALGIIGLVCSITAQFFAAKALYRIVFQLSVPSGRD